MQIRLTQHRPFVHRAPGPWPSLLTFAVIVALLIAAIAIWPSARLAVSAYEATGFVTLLAFMGFVFALATALGVVAVTVLAGDDT